MPSARSPRPVRSIFKFLLPALRKGPGSHRAARSTLITAAPRRPKAVVPVDSRRTVFRPRAHFPEAREVQAPAPRGVAPAVAVERPVLREPAGTAVTRMAPPETALEGEGEAPTQVQEASVQLRPARRLELRAERAQQEQRVALQELMLAPTVLAAAAVPTRALEALAG